MGEKDLEFQRKRRRSEVDVESPIPFNDSKGLLAQSSTEGDDRSSSLDSLALLYVPTSLPQDYRKPVSTFAATTALPQSSESIRSAHRSFFKPLEQEEIERLWGVQWRNCQILTIRRLARATQWYSELHNHAPTHPAHAGVQSTTPDMMTPEFVMRSAQYSPYIKKRFVGELSVHWANLKQHYHYGDYLYAETQIRGISRAIAEAHTVSQIAAALKPQRLILKHKVALQAVKNVQNDPALVFNGVSVLKGTVMAKASKGAPASQPHDQKRKCLPIVYEDNTTHRRVTREASAAVSDGRTSRILREKISPVLVVSMAKHERTQHQNIQDEAHKRVPSRPEANSQHSVDWYHWSGNVLLLGLVYMTCRAKDHMHTFGWPMVSLAVLTAIVARITKYCDTRKDKPQVEPRWADEQIKAQSHHTTQTSERKPDESSSGAAKLSNPYNATIEEGQGLRHDQESSPDDSQVKDLSYATLALRLASCEAETSKMKELQSAYKVAYRKQAEELKSSREKEQKARDISDMYASAMDKRETETVVLENAHDALGAKKRVLEKRYTSLQHEKAQLVEHVAHLRDVVDLHEAERISKHDAVKQNLLSLILENATRYQEQVAQHEINQKHALKQILTLKTQNQKLVESEAALAVQLKGEADKVTELRGSVEALEGAHDDDNLRQRKALVSAHRQKMVKVHAKLKNATKMEKSLQDLTNKSNQLEYRIRWDLKKHNAVEAGLTGRLESEAREVDRLKIEVQTLKKENREMSGIEEWVRVRNCSSLQEAANGAGEVATMTENQEIADDTQGSQQTTMAGNGQDAVNTNGLVEVTAESSESDEDDLTPTRAQIEFALAHARFWKPQQTADTDESDAVNVADTTDSDEGEMIEHGNAEDIADV